MNERFLLLGFFALSGVTAACGGATTTTLGSTGDGGASSSGSGESGASSGGGPSVDATAPDATVDGSVSMACGHTGENEATPCPAGLWCDYGPLRCSGKGVCRLKPASAGGCPPGPTTESVCGCDGKDYCTEDGAHFDGVAVAVPGKCAPSCGPHTCNALYEYCDHGYGGVALPDGGVNEFFACKQYAQANCVTDRTCACVQANPATKGEACEEPHGHVEVKHYYP